MSLIYGRKLRISFLAFLGITIFSSLIIGQRAIPIPCPALQDPNRYFGETLSKLRHYQMTTTHLSSDVKTIPAVQEIRVVTVLVVVLVATAVMVSTNSCHL